jgi:hypothetical protein
MSVVAATMAFMTAMRSLRRIGDSVVAGAPSGLRIRTRIRLSDAEAEALKTIGTLLGSVYRGELANRICCGAIDFTGQAAWRAERKRAVTAVSSSRWAGAITRTVEDQYQLGMRNLAAHVADLRAAVNVLTRRCALRPGESAPESGDGMAPRRRGGGRGYRSAAERFAKTRRLATLSERLTAAEKALTAGHPSITVGGNRLWRSRNYLDATQPAENEWRKKWDAARIFLTADGESGTAGGNATIRVDQAGQLRIKVPAALVDDLGTHVVIAAPVRFTYLGDDWAQHVAARRAIRYDISYNAERDRWYLDASWTVTPAPAPTLDELRTGRVLGVDLNADHLAVCVLDACGNPVGRPASIEMLTAGLSASRRDGRIRAAITALLDHARLQQCGAVVVENLNFDDARATGRETLGGGRRGKRFRQTVAGIPTAQFRKRLIAMASRRGVGVIAVDAAYTSRWGHQHWRDPLQQQTSDPVTGHHAAAVAIGRRGLALAIRRRPAGRRNGQRTVACTPPTRSLRQPKHVGRRRSSGSPTRPHEAGRSTGKHPPAAAKTVRAAQESLLLSNWNGRVLPADHAAARPRAIKERDERTARI